MAEPNPNSQEIASSILQVIINAIEAQKRNAAPAANPAAPAAAPAQPLTPIDQWLGGSSMVGMKTPIAIILYVILSILQSQGVVGTATGDPAPPQATTQTTQTQTPAADAAHPPAAAPTTPNAPKAPDTHPAPAATGGGTATQGTGAQASATPAKPEGTKTPTGQILTTLIMALGALGLTSKFDRLIQALVGVAKS